MHFVDCLDIRIRTAAVRRILLTDAPPVVGSDVWRDIDSRNGLGHLPENRVDIYAHALLTEMALLAARADDHEAAAVAGRDTVALVLTRLASRSC